MSADNLLEGFKMDLLKLENDTIQRLYEAFKDNDGFTVKEDEKYKKATEEILELNKKTDIQELIYLRDNFVYTISDLTQASRTLESMSDKYRKMTNVWMNMLQYVTTEIDCKLFKLGADV
jgi:hypothetical protein